jgi:hypothetical protein
MDESVVREIQRLKEEIFRRKEEIQDIKELVKREIDRQFQVDLGELSERELGPELEKTLFSIENNIYPKPDIKSFKSHRKMLGKPILWLKRRFIRAISFYIDVILDKQKQFNKDSLALHKASLNRLGRSEELAKQIEKRLSHCEENVVIIINRLEDLQSSIKKLLDKIKDDNPASLG